MVKIRIKHPFPTAYIIGRYLDLPTHLKHQREGEAYGNQEKKMRRHPYHPIPNGGSGHHDHLQQRGERRRKTPDPRHPH